MYDDQAIRIIDPMVGASFASWSMQLASAATTEDKVRRLQQAGDYGVLFGELMMHIDADDYGEELNEIIEDFLFNHQPSNSTDGAPSKQARWDEPVLSLLRAFREQHFD